MTDHIHRSILFVAILVASSQVFAAEPTASSKPPLRVAQFGTYMPLHGVDEDGQPAGLEASLARALGKEMGREVVFVDTRKELKLGSIDAVASGKVDIAINAIMPTPERAQKVDFTSPYVELSVRAVAPGLGDSIGDPLALTCKIGVAAGPIAELVRAKAPKAQVVEYPSLAKAMAAVQAGEIMMAADDEVALLSELRETKVLLLNIKWAG